MTDCTLLYSFYNQQTVADIQCRMWNSYPDDIKKKLCIITIDDGSTPPLHFDVDSKFAFVHLRATEDIPWNQPGAKNLGMHFAPTEWVFLSDTDLMLTPEAARSLLDTPCVGGTVYIPARLKNGQPCNPHPNSFLLRKVDFFSIGGYDEDFCGNYGYDDLVFVEKVKRRFEMSPLDRVVLTIDQDYSTPDIVRDQRNNKKLLKKKKRQLDKNRYITPGMLRFKWTIDRINPPLMQ